MKGLLVLGALVAAVGVAVQPKPPRLKITSPANGAVTGPDVTVTFAITGAEVVPASGVKEPGKGHHHLFVDADLSPRDSVVPKTEAIHHLGDGSRSIELKGLAPGRHRLIAVFAYGTHVPMDGVNTDTVVITVRAPRAAPAR